MSKNTKVRWIIAIKPESHSISCYLRFFVSGHLAPLPLNDTVRTPEEIQASRLLVLSDLLESEKAHVAEIRGLLENFLEPLASSQM